MLKHTQFNCTWFLQNGLAECSYFQPIESFRNDSQVANRMCYERHLRNTRQECCTSIHSTKSLTSRWHLHKHAIVCASNGPVLGRCCRIGPVPAQYWHIMACLQGITCPFTWQCHDGLRPAILQQNSDALGIRNIEGYIYIYFIDIKRVMFDP